jgi:hypothetical protein
MAKASGSPVGDDELRSELKRLGFEAGPITDTTRQIYTDKLKQLKTKTSDSPPLLKPAQSPVSLRDKPQLGSQTQSVATCCSSGGVSTTTIKSVSRETGTQHSSSSTTPPSSLPLPQHPLSSPASNSVVSQLLQSLNNGGHLASDTAFLFPGGEVFLASRSILSTQCLDLLPILYNREDVFVVNVSTLSGHTSRFFARPSELVRDLKEKISLVEAVSVPEQRIFFDQTELGNETRISQTAMADGCVVHLVVNPLSPCEKEQQETMYFSSSVSPALSIHHLCLSVGLEQLIPMGGALPHLRPPRLPLPPHICHIVHVYDVPYPAWAAFVQFLYSHHLREGI